MAQKSKNNFRHNFNAFLWHGTFLYVANAFTQLTTVQASLIYLLTGSSFLSGLLFSFNRIGNIVPQLFLVSRVQAASRKKPWLIAAILTRSLAMVLSAAILYFVFPYSAQMATVGVFAILLLFFLAGGMGGVSYFAVFSKSIAPDQRGRNLGYRYFTGGLLGLGAGYATKQILAGPLEFPQNFALLYLLSGIFLFIAFGGFYAVREPAEPGKISDRGLRGHFSILRDNSNFRRFILVEVLLGATMVLLPLYIIYATEELHLALSLTGVFVAAQIVGEIISGPLWGKLGDRFNFRMVLFSIGLISTATPLLAIILPQYHPWLYLVIFLLVGMTFKGLSLAVSSYLLEIAPREQVPSYVAVKNIMQLPTIIYPLMGGWLAHLIGYQSLFILVSVILAGGTLLAMRLNCVKSIHPQKLFMQRFWE